MKLYENRLIKEYFDMYHIGMESPNGHALNIMTTYFATEGIWHNAENHIKPMLQEISEWPNDSKEDAEEQFVAFFFALYHDIEPSPMASITKMVSIVNAQAPMFRYLFEDVIDAIRATDYKFESLENQPEHVKNCIELDVMYLGAADHDEINRVEHLMFKEYQSIEYPLYVNTRIKVLKHMIDILGIYEDEIKNRIKILKNRKIRTAVFPGSFNPFHIGHLDILCQAEKDFDKVIVAVCMNKPSAIVKDRITILRALLPNQVDGYNGLLHDYLGSKQYDVTLIRGLRDSNDVIYEANMKATLEDIIPDVHIVYYMCKKQLSHVSSSMVRDVAAYSPESAKKYTDI